MTEDSKAEKTPLWEKLTGLAGLILLCGVFLVLLWRALTDLDGQVEIVIEPIGVHPSGDYYLVLVEVENRGSQTVADLSIQGQLQHPDGSSEIAELTVDYLPAGSRQEGGLFFTRNPNAGRATFRPIGYQKP